MRSSNRSSYWLHPGFDAGVVTCRECVWFSDDQTLGGRGKCRNHNHSLRTTCVCLAFRPLHEIDNANASLRSSGAVRSRH